MHEREFIERETITGRRRTAWRAVVVAAVLVVGTLPADAALTREACLAKKLAAWGTYQKCQATERAKAVRALSDKPTPQNPELCKTALLAKLFRLTTRAEKAAIACRFFVNSGGTVTDFDTGLEWNRRPPTAPCMTRTRRSAGAPAATISTRRMARRSPLFLQP
jgi:hypothetical protein